MDERMDGRERCTMMTCYYNDNCVCLCCDDARSAEMLEDCPSFIED